MKTILVIQSEPLLLEVCKRILDGRYSMVEAASATEALETYRQFPGVDLLITDVMLPVISGMELASLLKAWSPRLRILLTAETPFEYWTEEQQTAFYAIRSECVAILEKPFYPDQLRAEVENLIGPPENVPTRVSRSAAVTGR